VEEEKVSNKQNLGGRTLSAIGQAQGNAFQNALNAFQQNQALQTQAGLQGGVQLGTLGQLQQEMAGTDIAKTTYCWWIRKTN
jgi:hypothetical protein